MKSICKAVGMLCVLAALSGQAHAVFAPEIDPGSMAGGLSLLIGGMMLIVDRRRKK